MDIIDLFHSYSNKDVHLLRNPGNKGDGLIYAGTLALFEKYKVHCKEIVFPQQGGGEVLFVSGGGAFARSFNHMVDYIGYYIKNYKKIFVLPQTFELSCHKVKRFIHTLPENICLYCREKVSYHHVLAEIKNKNNVFLNKDMAFYLDYSPYLRKGTGTLLAFRGDREAPFWSLLVSTIFKKYNRDVALGDEDRWAEMVYEIASYKTVHTNRLHVSICAAMLKKRTYLYSSNFFKQKAVYDFILKKFNNVKFIQLGPFKGPVIPSSFYKAIFSSVLFKLRHRVGKNIDNRPLT